MTAAPGPSFEVNEDNVLAARATILNAADEAMLRLGQLRYDMIMQPCGEDKISKDAAALWNDRLVQAPDSHASRLGDYIKAVQELGLQLEDAAKQYGFTEEEIEASFKATQSPQV